MKTVSRLFGMMMVLGLAIAPCFAQISETQARTRGFLDAYVHGDTDTILQSIDNDAVVYGSDAGEVFRGRAGVATMMREDAQLWRGSATIGDMTDVSVVEQGDLSTIFFNAPFRVGNREPVPVRFCLIWKRSGGHWLLVQSQSAALTQGQSAAALLKSSK
jgi:ketosteroid isomerase-like protein